MAKLGFETNLSDYKGRNRITSYKAIEIAWCHRQESQQKNGQIFFEGKQHDL